MIRDIIQGIAVEKIDAEDRKYIVPHFPGGMLTPGDLRKIADLCEKYPESKIKQSGEIIIGGIRDVQRNDDARRNLGLPTASIAGFCVRPVRICSGGYICDNNQQDSLALGLELDRLFCGRKLPFKLIISVSGCARSCSEPLVKDIGIRASRSGFNMYVGGAAGANPRIAVELATRKSHREIIGLTTRVIELYEKQAKMAERLGKFIERTGFDKFREQVL
jgi:NAD(P)H-nitrite reductase large subunit